MFLNINKTKITVRLSQNIKRSRAAVSPESIESRLLIVWYLKTNYRTVPSLLVNGLGDFVGNFEKVIVEELMVHAGALVTNVMANPM